MKARKNQMSVFRRSYMPSSPIKRIRYTIRKCKWVWQRATRGYADCDTWDIRGWFLGVMPEILKDMAQDMHGIPYAYVTKDLKPVKDHNETDVVMTEDVWKMIILRMAADFRKADEESYEIKNPMEEEWLRMHESYREEIKKDRSTDCISPARMKPEWKEITDRYLEEEKKIAQKRQAHFNRGILYFREWFWDMWD